MIIIIAVSTSKIPILIWKIIYRNIITSPIILTVHFNVLTILLKDLLFLLAIVISSILVENKLKQLFFRFNALTSLIPLTVSFTNVVYLSVFSNSLFNKDFDLFS